MKKRNKIEAQHDQVKATFKVRTGTFDARIVREIWEAKQYTRLPEFVPQEGDFIVDIGAHIGVFSILAAKYGAEVLAFEPSPENFKILNKNISLNEVLFDENINKRSGTVYPMLKAIIGKPETYYFYKSEDETNTGGGFITTLKNRKNIEGVLIDTNSLEDIFKAHARKCDLLKIDVEGAEYDILYDAPKEIFKNIEKIVLEWHGTHEQGEQLRDYMVKLGYEAVYFDGDNERGLLFLTKL